MKRFMVALEFLTVFKLRRNPSVISTGELSASMAVFPLVGALQGLILAVSAWGLGFILPWGAVAALVVLIGILTNGGLHLDGLSDTIDGLAGGNTPEERLRIMRDSSVGALGAAAVALVLIIKYSALREVPEGFRLSAVFLMPVAGRWAVVPMACLAGPARRDGGLGSLFAANSAGVTATATILAAILFYFAFGGMLLSTLSVLLIIGLTVYMFTMFFKRKLGGVTGDVFGFQSEIAEVLFMLVFLAFERHEFLGGIFS
ncbi:adenosylcobinamide-GDP ribazoletransferase [bacterium]|nr:MAG: adenosylcobinamide-GDP ribazoletransferase [bacterium]